MILKLRNQNCCSDSNQPCVLVSICLATTVLLATQIAHSPSVVDKDGCIVLSWAVSLMQAGSGGVCTAPQAVVSQTAFSAKAFGFLVGSAMTILEPCGRRS